MKDWGERFQTTTTEHRAALNLPPNRKEPAGASVGEELKSDIYDELARERFWRKVKKTKRCWLWMGAITSEGYGSLVIQRKPLKAHRVAYEMCGNIIPEGMTLDHLCRVRACVNPNHLEPISNRDNILRGVGASARNIRKTHCVRGHLLSGENLYIKPNHPDWRICLICRLVEQAARDFRRKGLAS